MFKHKHQLLPVVYKNHQFDFLIYESGDDFVSEEIRRSGIWEKHLTDVWYDNINAGDLVIDVGANIGWYTKIAELKGAEVISFEPDPKAYDLLKLNCTKTQELYECCVGDVNGTINLQISDDNYGDNRTAQSGGIQRKQVTIDEVVGNRSHRVKAIKIDTQGWEPNILKGAINTLANAPKGCIVIIEYWPYGLNVNGFNPHSYKPLLEHFKVIEFDNITFDVCKNNPHIHTDIILRKM